MLGGEIYVVRLWWNLAPRRNHLDVGVLGSLDVFHLSVPDLLDPVIPARTGFSVLAGAPASKATLRSFIAWKAGRPKPFSCPLGRPCEMSNASFRAVATMADHIDARF